MPIRWSFLVLLPNTSVTSLNSLGPLASSSSSEESSLYQRNIPLMSPSPSPLDLLTIS